MTEGLGYDVTWWWTAELFTVQDEMDELELGSRVADEFVWQEVTGWNGLRWTR